MRKGPINTIPHRLLRRGFRPIGNFRDKVYQHHNGDLLSRIPGTFGIGWYLTTSKGIYVNYSCLKRLMVDWIENSTRYKEEW